MNFSKVFEQSQRPLLLLGAGVRQAGMADKIEGFVNRLNIPVLLTWGGMDLLHYNHPLNCGGFGTCGPHAGNLALHESDFVLSMGARLNTQEIGSDAALFAPNATKIIIESDHAEVTRLAKLSMQVIIYEHDLRSYVASDSLHHPGAEDWRQRIKENQTLYSVGGRASRHEPNYLNPYLVIESICQASQNGDIILTDAGATLCWIMQTWKVKRGQRLLSSWNHSPMGWALPASIGAAFANPDANIICITGDGSFFMNMQELAIIARHSLKVNIFVLDNNGYGIIRQTQDTWLEGRHYASEMTGTNIAAICQQFGLAGVLLTKPSDLIYSLDNPACYQVFIDPDARIVPKSRSGKLEVPEQELDKIRKA